MKGAPTYLIRTAGPGDFEVFKQLRALAGPGFTSLMVDDAGLKARLEKAAHSFAADVSAPGDERYLLVMDEIGGQAGAGCVGVKACVGESPPFFNFRVLKIAQASAAAQRRFDLDVLILVNEFAGCSEVGSLFVRAEHRAHGVGRLLAQSRYLMMAAAPHRFAEKIVSELRGMVSPEGRSPFWEHLGRHFFRMSFQEADLLSATTDNQFILDLMPKYPIYADLLPEEARAAIGEAHEDGRAARRLLEWEGFRYDGVVDIFDGGPLLSVSRDAIRTLRETRRMPLRAGAVGPGARRALIATPAIAAFRCAPALARLENGEAVADPATLTALGLEDGADALIWMGDAV
ncbi:MAG: arginine N-succinyltransferase [Hyphomonadaceae bacterium]